MQKPNYFQRRTKFQGPRTNHRIKSIDVQVINSNGENLGVLPIKKAIDMSVFEQHQFYYAPPPIADLYFWGLKYGK